MNSVSFCLVLLNIHLVYANSEKPQIPKFNENHDREVGTPFILTCSAVKGVKPFTFDWFKNGHKISANQRYQIDSKQSYSVFTIPEVDHQDSGNYSCVVHNKIGFDKQSTLLNVKVPPSWIKEPKDVNIRAGEEYSVECLADGLPKPKITWNTPSGKRIDNEVLNLNQLIKSEKNGRQSLQFECVADNGIGDALRKTITVSYNVPVKFYEKYQSIQAKRGEPIKLKCNATGDQPIAIQWTKAGVKIEKNDGHNYEIDDIPTSRGILSELTIKSIQKSDGAIYKCDAENEHGKDDRTIKLTVVEEPSPPENVKVNEAWSRSAQISWRSSYNGNSPINRYIIHYWRKQSASNHHQLHEFNVSSSPTTTLLKNLNPGWTYELSIIAENDVGRSEPSEKVTIVTGEEEPSAPPNDFNVEPKGPTTIRITWRAPPKESWNGRIKGYYIGYKKSSDSSSAYNLKSIDSKHNDPALIENEQHEYFLRDLHKGSEYQVVIKAHNSAGSGPESHVLHVRTLDGDLPPTQHLEYIDSTPTSIYLRWSQKDLSIKWDQASPILSYTLHYQKEGEPKWNEIPLTSLSTSAPLVDATSIPTFTYTMSNLEQGAQYRFFVTALNRYGYSDPSNIVLSKTAGERLIVNQPAYSAGKVSEVPYYMQPEFTIPILTAAVIVIIISIFAYACVRRAKHRAATNLMLDTATLSKQLSAGYSTTPRYADFDKVSGKPLILTEQGNVFPTPYATNDVNQPWDMQTMMKNPQSHIYDHPQ